MSPTPLSAATVPPGPSKRPLPEDNGPMKGLPGEHLDPWLGLCATVVVMLAGAAAALV